MGGIDETSEPVSGGEESVVVLRILEPALPQGRGGCPYFVGLGVIDDRDHHIG